MTTTCSAERSTPPAPATGIGPRPPVTSEALLAGAREVQILHRGVVYRLRETALGKLILTK